VVSGFRVPKPQNLVFQLSTRGVLLPPAAVTAAAAAAALAAVALILCLTHLLICVHCCLHVAGSLHAPRHGRNVKHAQLGQLP
jgi:hypothetical protein